MGSAVDVNTAPQLTESLTGLLRDFVGRRWVLADVDRWLVDGGRRFVLVGAPGSGKTLVAARLVQRYGDPPPASGDGHTLLGAWHFCESARDITLMADRVIKGLADHLSRRVIGYPEALAESIGDQAQVRVHGEASASGPVAEGAVVAGVQLGALHVDARGPDPIVLFDRLVRSPLALLAGQQRLPARLLIVLDGLDEIASQPGGAELLDLLARVSGTSGELPEQVRILFTTRPDLRVTRRFGTADLDLIRNSPPDVDDVGVYINGRLKSVLPDQAAALAARITAAGAGNFLYARYALDDLLRDLETAEERSLRLPLGLDKHYRSFLDRELTRADELWEQRYRPLLSVLLAAGGDGFTASELAGITALRRSQVDDALIRLQPYVTGDGVRPLRLYHQSFADYLRAEQHYPIYVEEAHELVVDWFVARYGQDWTRADGDQYACQWLAFNAVQAGRLSELVEDPRFLVVAAPDELLTAIRFSTVARRLRSYPVLLAALHRLRGRSLGWRATYLELTAHQLGARDLARRIGGLPIARPWSFQWSRWSPVGTHYVVGSRPRAIRGMVLRQEGDRVAAVTIDDDGDIWTWDVAAALAIRRPLRGVGRSHAGLAVVNVRGQAVVVVGSDERGVVRVLDLTTGEAMGQLDTGGWVQTVQAADVDGALVIVTADSGSAVIWDFETHTRIGSPLASSDHRIVTVQAIMLWGGRQVLAHARVAGETFIVEFVSLATGAPARLPLRCRRYEPGDDVAAIAVGSVGGRALMALMMTDYGYGAVRQVWDLDTDTRLLEQSVGSSAFSPAVAIGEDAGRPLVVINVSEYLVQAFWLDDPDVEMMTFRGHNGPIRALGVVEFSSGRPGIVSAADDGTVRLWEMPAGDSPSDDESDVRWNHRLATGALGDREVVITSRYTDYSLPGGKLEVFDAATGVGLWEVELESVHPATVAQLDGDPVVVIVDSTCRGWALDETGTSVGAQDHYFPGVWAEDPPSVMVTTVAGKAVVAVGTRGVTVYGFDSALPIGPSAGSAWASGAIALGEVDGRMVLAYDEYDSPTPSTVKVWDVATGECIGEPREFVTGREHSHYGFDVRGLAVGTMDNEPVVVAGTDWSEVWVWNPLDPARAMNFQPHVGSVRAVALASLHSREVLLTGDSGGLLRVWSRAGVLLTSLDVGAHINALATLPGDRIAVACDSGLLLVQLGELDSGQR